MVLSLDYGHDTRLNEWNIAKDPINKKVVVYLINPDEGTTAKSQKHIL